MKESLRTSTDAGTRAVNTKQLQTTFGVTVSAIAILIVGVATTLLLSRVLPYRLRVPAGATMVVLGTVALAHRTGLVLWRAALGGLLGACAIWAWHDVLRGVLRVGYPDLGRMHQHWAYNAGLVLVVLGLSLSDLVRTWRERARCAP